MKTVHPPAAAVMTYAERAMAFRALGIALDPEQARQDYGVGYTPATRPDQALAHFIATRDRYPLWWAQGVGESGFLLGPSRGGPGEGSRVTGQRSGRKRP